MPTPSLDKLHKVAPIFKDIFEAVAKELKRRIQAGEESSVAAIGMRKGSDEVTDLGKAQEALASIGVDAATFEKCLSFSLSELKELVSKAAPRGQKAAAANRVVQVLAQAGVLKLGEETETLTRKK